ncbi:hypothetical protein CDL15_Pgr022010 [Punica granatum]|uniref:Uncharacterized protein n=1 Tax=Punica granatum TaxID=22663 RepID=A0A218XGK0_PUNGR|nr:hypothetical protein CDL15_Pgr022010 [Punica granatum]
MQQNKVQNWTKSKMQQTEQSRAGKGSAVGGSAEQPARIPEVEAVRFRVEPGSRSTSSLRSERGLESRFAGSRSRGFEVAGLSGRRQEQDRRQDRRSKLSNEQCCRRNFKIRVSGRIYW